MKKVRAFFLVLLTAFAVSGCFETTEEITIAGNGSGNYRMGMDLAGVFDMLDVMRAADTSGKMDAGFPKERKDTTIRFRSFTDTATTLTAEQKALYKDATMQLLMDEAEKEFKINVNLPFAKPADLENVLKLMQSNDGNVFSKLMKGSNALGEDADMGEGNTNPPGGNNFYDVTMKAGMLERKLNKQKYDSAMQLYGDQLTAEGIGDMLASMEMNTVIHLPAPAKKITGSKLTASADKKTITLKGTMAEMLKTPEDFSYRIEY